MKKVGSTILCFPQALLAGSDENAWKAIVKLKLKGNDQVPTCGSPKTTTTLWRALVIAGANTKRSMFSYQLTKK